MVINSRDPKGSAEEANMERTAAVTPPLPQVMPTLTPTAPRAHADPKVIGKAFEGIFVSLLIKQMRQSLDGGLFGNDHGDVLGGMFDHFLGEHIAQSGRFGIADMVRMQLEHQPGRTRPA